MTKRLIFIAALLAGCHQSEEQLAPKALPPELAHCKIYYVQAEGAGMYVMHCPNAETAVTRTSGKTTMRTITIDGKKYQEASHD